MENIVLYDEGEKNEIGNGAGAGATSINVTGNYKIGEKENTSGTKTKTGEVTTVDSRTLQGSTIQFVSTVTGTTAASDDLTITGALNLDGAITDINDLYVSGTTDLGANIATTSTKIPQQHAFWIQCWIWRIRIYVITG